MELLSQYKESVKERLDNADVLISKLVNENTLLTTKIDAKDQTIDQLRKQIAELQAANRSLQDNLDKSEEDIEVVKDLFEHLCGVRIHTLYEDDSGLWFDASQGRRNAANGNTGYNGAERENEKREEQKEGGGLKEESIMDYKLGFVKGDNSETEVIYVPLLKQRSTEELRKLQEHLPTYMFDTLSFPLRSLNQFYNKMSKCLGKAPGVSPKKRTRGHRARTRSRDEKSNDSEGRNQVHNHNQVTATTPTPTT